MNDVKFAKGKGTTVNPPTLESVVPQTVAIFEARYRPEGHKDGASWEAMMFSGYTGQKQRRWPSSTDRRTTQRDASTEPAASPAGVQRRAAAAGVQRLAVTTPGRSEQYGQRNTDLP